MPSGTWVSINSWVAPGVGLAASPDEYHGSLVQRIAEMITAGGWPDNLGSTSEQAQPLVRGYVAEIGRTDIQRVDGVRRDPENSQLGDADRELRRLDSCASN